MTHIARDPVYLYLGLEAVGGGVSPAVVRGRPAGGGDAVRVELDGHPQGVEVGVAGRGGSPAPTSSSAIGGGGRLFLQGEGGGTHGVTSARETQKTFRFQVKLLSRGLTTKKVKAFEKR